MVYAMENWPSIPCSLRSAIQANAFFAVITTSRVSPGAAIQACYRSKISLGLPVVVRKAPS
jgi:hypothetical protein